MAGVASGQRVRDNTHGAPGFAFGCADAVHLGLVVVQYYNIHNTIFAAITCQSHVIE